MRRLPRPVPQRFPCTLPSPHLARPGMFPQVGWHCADKTPSPTSILFSSPRGLLRELGTPARRWACNHSYQPHNGNHRHLLSRCSLFVSRSCRVEGHLRPLVTTSRLPCSGQLSHRCHSRLAHHAALTPTQLPTIRCRRARSEAVHPSLSQARTRCECELRSPQGLLPAISPGGGSREPGQSTHPRHRGTARRDRYRPPGCAPAARRAPQGNRRRRGRRHCSP